MKGGSGTKIVPTMARRAMTKRRSLFFPIQPAIPFIDLQLSDHAAGTNPLRRYTYARISATAWYRADGMAWPTSTPP